MACMIYVHHYYLYYHSNVGTTIKPLSTPTVTPPGK